MNFYIILCTISNILYYVSCQLDSSFIKPLANDTCGISTGAPIVQQLTNTVSYSGGLFWSDFGAKIAYIDRYGPAFGRYTPNDGRFNRMQINEGMESIVIFPVKNATGTGLKFVIGLDNRLVLADITGSGTNLKSKIYNLITVTEKPEKFMRGKCDNKGRLWYSSTGEGSGREPKGHLYKIDYLGTPQVVLTKLYCGAGMAWTKDYKYFYLVDSDMGVIFKYDFNDTDGTLSNERIVFRLSDQTSLEGKPFDIAVDTNNYLWIGLLHGGSVVQYDETSNSIISNIAIPASDIVSLEFGGLDKKTLYVGTKKNIREPVSGAIFGVSGLGATGIPDNEIVIPNKYRNL